MTDPTPIFDGETSRRGFRMNKLFMSLRTEANRERFGADEAAYCQEFGLSPEQQRAVLDRDWQAMIDLGGVFTGMGEDDFLAAMRAGGRRDG